MSEIEKNLNKINSYLSNPDSKVSQNVLDKSKIILDKIGSKKSTLERNRLWDIIGVILLVLAIVLLNWEFCKFYLLYLIRFLVILGSNFYDFTQLYRNNCLIQNPFFIPTKRFHAQTCQFACGKTNQKNFLKKFQSEIYKTQFEKITYDSDVPVIVNNEINEWKLTRMDLKDLIESYKTSDEPVQEDHLCYFDHTLNQNFETKFKAFNEAIKDNRNYSFLWENCGKTSYKRLKKLINRPTFLPNNLELVSNSWVFMSKNMSNEYLQIPVSLRIALFCQISGTSKLKISPVNECKKYCPSKTFSLKPGQIMVYSDLWNLEFKPVNDGGENLAITLLVQ